MEFVSMLQQSSLTDKVKPQEVIKSSHLFSLLFSPKSNLSFKADSSFKMSGVPTLSEEQLLLQQLIEKVALYEQVLKLDNDKPKIKFFDQQIQVQPPDLPNSTIASPLTPGVGYAPSIPLLTGFQEGKICINDLLVRAKASMQAGDV